MVTTNLILGGGISGLAAARALMGRGKSALVLDACPDLGGLTRTIVVGQFSFDYTGHLLHLSRVERPSLLPYAGLNDDEWQKIRRRSVALVGGKLVTAPVQYNLGEVPEPMRTEYIKSYKARSCPCPADHVTFQEYLIQGFGIAMATQFLIPQNQKTLAAELGTLTSNAVKRFFPPPIDERVLAGITLGSPKPVEYNSTFWYPKTGGIKALVTGLARGVDARLMQEAKRLDLNRQEITTRNQKYQYKNLISSIPLKKLCQITPELQKYAPELTHSQTVVLNIGMQGNVPEALEGVHWVYVPDREIPFYRVGLYSNLSQVMAPEGTHSFYVEMGLPGETAVNLRNMQEEALRWMEKLGWLDRSQIEVCVLTRIPIAYVHHTQAREHVLEEIKPFLKSARVHLIGRYGTWDYISMEDAIYQGINVGGKL